MAHCQSRHVQSQPRHLQRVCQKVKRKINEWRQRWQKGNYMVRLKPTLETSGIARVRDYARKHAQARRSGAANERKQPFRTYRQPTQPLLHLGLSPYPSRPYWATPAPCRDVAASRGTPCARAPGLHGADVAGDATRADDDAVLDGGTNAVPGAGGGTNARPYAVVGGRAVPTPGTGVARRRTCTDTRTCTDRRTPIGSGTVHPRGPGFLPPIGVELTSTRGARVLAPPQWQRQRQRQRRQRR